ncbi:helix-turn-helix domain-containing protein [Nocardia sp. NPDC046473]|uniref:TetR/AcrR family transcriptional regulator n=1 Tax=Nocardia sp. NPDC046473 TaxID=3155733 RepID=UPI0033C077A0
MSHADTVTYSAGAVETALAVLSGSAPAPLPRHKHDLSREQVRETQSGRVLAAAIVLFAEQGYAATTVMHIAQRAGVSRKTYYELFDSKEDVFLDAYRAVSVLLDAARDSLDQEQDRPELAPDTIEDYCRFLLQFLAIIPAATRMFFLEALGVGPRVRARRNESITEFVAGIAPALQQLRSRYEPALPPLDTQLCYAITAAGIEMIVQHLADGDPETLTTLAPEVSDLVRAIVTPNHTAHRSR